MSPTVQRFGFTERGTSPSRWRSTSSSFSCSSERASTLVLALLVTVRHSPAASRYLKRQPRLYEKTVPICCLRLLLTPAPRCTARLDPGPELRRDEANAPAGESPHGKG